MVSFRIVAVSLASALLASAASISRRNTWLQQNGPAAQALNDQYLSLTADQSCNDDDVACIGGQFAHCYQGQWFTYGCPDNWSCAAIPREFGPGTSTTCDSNDNIAYRFAQAGISETKRSEPEAQTTAQLQANGPAAKTLNEQYATLNANSPCSGDQVACVDGRFATCYQGKWQTFGCPSNWECVALPNEFSSGTTTTCALSSVVQWRLQEAGAQ